MEIGENKMAISILSTRYLTPLYVEFSEDDGDKNQALVFVDHAAGKLYDVFCNDISVQYGEKYSEAILENLKKSAEMNPKQVLSVPQNLIQEVMNRKSLVEDANV